MGYPSLTGSKGTDSTSGAMLQGIVKLASVQATAPVLLTQEELLLPLLAKTSIASLALMGYHPTSGTPPTHCGMAKGVTMVASAVTTLVCRGS